jgi:hypothetical protein
MKGFETGEINILLGDDAAYNLRASLALSSMLRTSGKFDHIVYINLPFSRRRFSDACKEMGAEKVGTLVYHISGGRLARSVAELRGHELEGERTAVIINSWELSSSCYRYREDLIYKLRELQMDMGVTVFVFAMSDPAKVAVRKMNRTGLGKLSLTADLVVDLMEEEAEQDIASEETREESEEMANIITAETLKRNEPDRPPVREYATLPISNFNDLPTPNGHLNRKERRRHLQKVANG